MQKNPELPSSGERMQPGVKDALIIIEHLHRYLLANRFCKGKTVLDIASGEGYGTEILSRNAEKVIGIDIDVTAISYSSEKYKGPNRSFRAGSATNIALDDDSVDVVVSFETLEHVVGQDDMLKEIRRVLRPGGILVMSTPDKKYYSEIPEYKNEYHLKELYSHEFRDLVSRYFPHVQLLAQFAGSMSFIYPFEDPAINSYWYASVDISGSVSESPIGSRYLIAIAGDSPVNYKQISIFDGHTTDQKIRS